MTIYQLKKIDINLKNEIIISNKIKQIPNYEKRFLPINQYSHTTDDKYISVEYDINSNLTDTNVINTNNITLVNFFSYIIQNKDKHKKFIILQLFNSYLYLIDSLYILHQNNVNYLVDESNIVFYNNNPIITNFKANKTVKNKIFSSVIASLNLLFVKLINLIFFDKNKNKLIKEFHEILSKEMDNIQELKQQSKKIFFEQNKQVYLDLI